MDNQLKDAYRPTENELLSLWFTVHDEWIYLFENNDSVQLNTYSDVLSISINFAERFNIYPRSIEDIKRIASLLNHEYENK